MCTNFIPSASDMLVQFGVERAPFDFMEEAYPGYDAPIVRHIVRKNEEHGSGRECVPARFGLVPYWAKPEDVTRLGRLAHNSRSETTGQKPMFKNAWKRRQFCLIPVECFYEPCWDSGKAVRWKIWVKEAKVFAIAGIWEHWHCGEESIVSFSMLTVNADNHAVMRNFHRHGEEKRMPVILRADDHERWLGATPEEAFRLCQPFPAEQLDAEAAPKPRKMPTLPPGGLPPLASSDGMA